MAIQAQQLNKAKSILDEAVQRGGLVFAAGLVGDANGTLLSHVAGSYSGDAGRPAQEDAIFAIASMTKLVTTVAALQLVDRGQLDLDMPADPSAQP